MEKKEKKKDVKVNIHITLTPQIPRFQDFSGKNAYLKHLFMCEIHSLKSH